MSNLCEQVQEELYGITGDAEEYATSEDSPLAEFVGSLFYGEASVSDLNLDNCDEPVRDAIKRLIKKSGKSWRSVLLKYTYVRHVNGVYREDDEILSAVIGEQEHQIDSSMPIVSLINQLTPSEFEKIKLEFLASNSKQGQRDYWFYTVHDYERFGLFVDEDRLLADYGDEEEIE